MVGLPSELELGAAEGWLRPPVRSDGLAEVQRVKSAVRILEVVLDDREV